MCVCVGVCVCVCVCVCKYVHCVSCGCPKHFQSDLENALGVFEAACVQAKDQREIEHVALYEKGRPLRWCVCVCVCVCDGPIASPCCADIRFKMFDVSKLHIPNSPVTH